MKQFVFLILTLGLCMAQQSDQTSETLPLYSCKKIDRNLNLDGKLGDRLWTLATPVSMRETVSGKNGRFETNVRLLYNNQYLYVGFQCEDTYVWGTHTRRDAPIYDEECVEVFLDPANSGYCYFELNLSPRNVIYDAFVLTARTEKTPGAKILPLFSYDMEGLITQTHIEGEADKPGKAKGWTAEYAIPFSECLGAPHLPPISGDRWRVNLYRIDSVKKGEQTLYAWNPTGYLKFHIPWRYGILHFE
jgi:hypothetical protein